MKKIIYIISCLVILMIVIITTIIIQSYNKEQILTNEQNILELYADKISKKSSYNNPIIPEGFKKIETDTASWVTENGIPKGWNQGLVIEDDAGNQFVWVPCQDLSKLKNDNRIINSNYNENEILQFLNYEGFYISRYEAGLPNEIMNNTKQFNNTTNNIEGIPLSKKNQIVWNFIDWNTAKNNAQHMYNKEKLKSDLTTLRQWEFIDLWLMDNLNNNYMDSKNYGNYSNVNFEFTGFFSNTHGKEYQYAENGIKKSENILLSTGASERNQTNNIYDLAGNVAEFLDSYQIIKNKKIQNIYSCIGGYYDNISTSSILNQTGINKANNIQGFRIVLYLP